MSIVRIPSEITVDIEGYAGIGNIIVVRCGACSSPIALTRDHYERLHETGDSFWCPHGHCRAYVESENARLRKQLAHAQEQTNAEATKRARAEALLAATEKRLHSGQKRSEAALCPHCRRHFVQMARHLAAKHGINKASVTPGEGKGSTDL